MKTLTLLVSAVLAVGCAQEIDMNQPPPGWCGSHFCMEEATVFTAAGEGIYDMLVPALARYRVATGREDLRTDVQAGIPVFWQEDIVTDGIEDCGRTIAKGFGTKMWTQFIVLDPTPPAGCVSPAKTLLHELIHALAPDVDHAETGLFAYNTQNDKIDAAALIQLCSEFHCNEFNPEE